MTLSTFLLTFVIVGLVVAGMAIGVIAGRKPIAGSCGGLGKIGLECDGGCENPCPKRRAKMEAARLEAERLEAERLEAERNQT